MFYQANGITQGPGPGIQGQLLYAQITGFTSHFVQMGTIVRDREARSATPNVLLIPYRNESELDIEEYDMIFIAKRRLPDALRAEDVDNPFASFNGLPLYPTAEEYRLRWQFIGCTLTPLSFSMDSQCRGVTVQFRGTVNYVNRTDEFIRKLDLVTWEPELDPPSLKDPFGGKPPAKRPRRTAISAAKGRFVRWQSRLSNFMSGNATDVFKKLYPTSWALGLEHDADLQAQLRITHALGIGEVFGESLEDTPPMARGRIALWK